MDRPFGALAQVESNLEALQAVLDDLDRRGVYHVVCVGSVVGLGPDPEACIDLVRSRCRAALAGSADGYVRTGDWSRSSAIHSNAVHEWTHARLCDAPGAGEARRSRWAWLRDLQARHDEPGLTLAHASARDPWDRVLSTSPEHALVEVLAAGEALQCVAGGIGEQGLVVEGPGATARWVQGGPDLSAPLAGRALLLPGWVGRLQLGAGRHTLARYATVERDVVRWHEVPYDRDAFEAKVRRMGLSAPAEARALGLG